MHPSHTAHRVHWTTISNTRSTAPAPPSELSKLSASGKSLSGTTLASGNGSAGKKSCSSCLLRLCSARQPCCSKNGKGKCTGGGHGPLLCGNRQRGRGASRGPDVQARVQGSDMKGFVWHMRTSWQVMVDTLNRTKPAGAAGGVSSCVSRAFFPQLRVWRMI